MITSLDNKKVKEWTKLHQKKYHTDNYLLLNEELIKSAYKHNLLDTLIYVDTIPFEFDNAYEVTEEVMNKISKKDNVKYIGIGKKINNVDSYVSRVLILDELQDPLNVGRIMENAFIFGFDNIILSSNTADIYHQKCLEASKGHIFDININRVNDLVSEINKLKQQGFKIYSTGLRKETKELFEVEPIDKMAFVLGNEGSGVEDKIFDISDQIIKIDMHNIDSLNVAMAASIVMYNFSK